MVDRPMNTPHVNVDTLSELSDGDAQNLVGKTIGGVQATEYGVLLTFTDGSTLAIRGHSYGDCALGVDFTSEHQTVKG